MDSGYKVPCDTEEREFQFCVSVRRCRPADVVDAFERAGKLHELAGVFGFLFESPLNGGRNREASLHIAPEEIEALNRRSVGYSFTLTNTAAAPEHLRDRWTNEMLGRFENPMNSVIVATPMVEEYVREKYPGYTLRASCIYNLNTPEEINTACERFDMVTPWPDINDHDAPLQALKYKDKIMLFGTQICLKTCGDHRIRHYYFWSLDHIAYYNRREYGVPYHPGDYHWHFRPPCRGRSCSVEMEDLGRFRRLGFRHIKITQFDIFAQSYLGTVSSPRDKAWAYFRRSIWKRPEWLQAR